MTPFVLTRLARQDLEEVWDYLAAENPTAAERVLTRIEETIMKLAKAPGMGDLREDLADRRHRFFWSTRTSSSTGLAPGLLKLSVSYTLPAMFKPCWDYRKKSHDHTGLAFRGV